MNESQQYFELIKPFWSPPAWVFGPAWSILYIIIAISFGVVFYKAYTKEISWIIALPFILNLIFNLSFTWFQFGLKNNLLASIDIIFVLGTLMWMLVAIYPYVAWIAYVNIPYLLWVSFATCLQITITYLNR